MGKSYAGKEVGKKRPQKNVKEETLLFVFRDQISLFKVSAQVLTLTLILNKDLTKKCFLLEIGSLNLVYHWETTKGMNLKLVAKKICEKSESINTPSETQQKKR